jgi:RNA polymerase sigma factor (sigma-70 family)
MLMSSRALQSDTTPDGEAWLRKCARNHALNFIRAKLRRQVHEIPLESLTSADAEPSSDIAPACTNPSAMAVKTELTVVLASSLAELTEAQQEIVQLRYIEGLSCHEIGDTTGRTPHAVSQALVTAKKRLRSLLESNGLTSADADEYLGIIHSASKKFVYLPLMFLDWPVL